MLSSPSKKSISRRVAADCSFQLLSACPRNTHVLGKSAILLKKALSTAVTHGSPLELPDEISRTGKPHVQICTASGSYLRPLVFTNAKTKSNCFLVGKQVLFLLSLALPVPKATQNALHPSPKLVYATHRLLAKLRLPFSLTLLSCLNAFALRVSPPTVTRIPNYFHSIG